MHADASQPGDWDEEEDGEWEPPKIQNPKCQDPGCGEWKPAQIPNPAYKGKWSPELIDNPEYKVMPGQKCWPGACVSLELWILQMLGCSQLPMHVCAMLAAVRLLSQTCALSAWYSVA